jgi:type I restriction enzyme R subunit
VYDACCYYDLFQDTPLKGKCAIVTSYEPQAGDITRENTGDGTDTYNEFKYETYTELLKSVTATPGMSKTSTYEENAKNRFVHEPANMKLLIVVDKLLTGFDAPPCSFLYIDKAMQDHGLFQAICRTNRLDGEDKSFGYVVDYKDLFRKVEGAMSVYASELDESAPGPSPQVLLENRVTKGRERIDTSIEVLFHLCEGVPLLAARTSSFTISAETPKYEAT